MKKPAFNIAPTHFEPHTIGDHESSLRLAIAKKFFEIGNRRGYHFLQDISGALSTTFSHPVFAMPHMDVSMSVHGFHTAFRPTDNDEGTHLVAFGQYYICSNLPLADQFTLVQDIYSEVIHSCFPSDIGLTAVKLEEGSYEWKADSTGYRGGGSEINVTSITINGKEYKLGRLELAQINDYAVSGDIQGQPCHLIVFGIDRLINLYAFAKALKEGIPSIESMSFQDLYLMEDKEAALHRGLVDVFRSSATNSSAILTAINSGLSKIENELEAANFSREVFKQLAELSSLTECAYAANIVTRSYRQYLIHRLGKLYAQFAKDIAAHPQLHFQLIKQSIALEPNASFSGPSIFDVLALPFFRRYFTISPRARERVVRHDIIPESLMNFFWDEEIVGGLKLSPSQIQKLKEQAQHPVASSAFHTSLQALVREEQRRAYNSLGGQPHELPQFLLKQRMFCCAVGDDLARPIESLAHPREDVATLAGTIGDRLARIDASIDFFRNEQLNNASSIDFDRVKRELRYLAVDWQYRSTKIYPQLEGIIGSVAMAQQGYESELVERVRAFHLAGTKHQVIDGAPETHLLILLGKLDEAVSLFVRSTEDGRSISCFDPFGVKAKILAATNSANALGVDLNALRDLVAHTVDANPNALGEEHLLSTGYFWTRIEKGSARNIFGQGNKEAVAA